MKDQPKADERWIRLLRSTARAQAARINRNDGRWFRVDNEILRWYQVVGGLGLIVGILFLKLSTLGVVAPRWLGWATIISGGILLGAPWKTPDRVSDVPESPEGGHGSDRPV